VITTHKTMVKSIYEAEDLAKNRITKELNLTYLHDDASITTARHDLTSATTYKRNSVCVVVYF
jgi:hypothetical protein